MLNLVMGIIHTKQTSGIVLTVPLVYFVCMIPLSLGLELTVSLVYFVYIMPLSQCLALTVPLVYFVCFIPLSQCLVLTSTCLFCVFYTPVTMFSIDFHLSILEVNTKYCDRGIKHTTYTSGSQY
jgi:hypothetical protein